MVSGHSSIAHNCTRKNCFAADGIRLSGEAGVTFVKGPVIESADCSIPAGQERMI